VCMWCYTYVKPQWWIKINVEVSIDPHSSTIGTMMTTRMRMTTRMVTTRMMTGARATCAMGATTRAVGREKRGVRRSASGCAMTMTRMRSRRMTRSRMTRSMTTETETETSVDAETSTVVSVSREAVRMTALGAVGALTWATSVDAANAATAALGQLSGLDPEGAKAASAVLGPLFAVSTILFIVRIVMTWYPSVPYTKLPWVLAYAPTEPLLKPTRALVPPVGGVDVSPIIWVMMISFMNEILLGKQGLLVLLSNKQLGG